jgi:GTPase SAR1 family protein
MQDQWFRQGHGFLVVYSIINKKSFLDVTPLRQKIERIQETNSVPMVLVCTKSTFTKAKFDLFVN